MAKAENIKRYSAEELAALRGSGKNQTDLALVRAKSEAETQRDITADPAWKGVHPNWHEAAQAVMPVTKELVSIRLDTDILEWFRDRGPGYQTRINAVLRAFVTQQNSVKPG